MLDHFQLHHLGPQDEHFSRLLDRPRQVVAEEWPWAAQFGPQETSLSQGAHSLEPANERSTCTAHCSRKRRKCLEEFSEIIYFKIKPFQPETFTQYTSFFPSVSESSDSKVSSTTKTGWQNNVLWSVFWLWEGNNTRLGKDDRLTRQCSDFVLSFFLTSTSTGSLMQSWQRLSVRCLSMLIKVSFESCN